MVELLKSSFSAFGDETPIKQVLLGKKIDEKKGNKIKFTFHPQPLFPPYKNSKYETVFLSSGPAGG